MDEFDQRPSPPGLLAGSRLATLPSRQPPQLIPRKPASVPSTSTHQPEVNNPTPPITAKLTEGQNFDSSEEIKTNVSSTLLQKSTKSQTSTSSAVTSLATNWWLLELLAVAFALSIFVALVILLWSYNDAPVPQWPHGITLNAAISILSTITRSLLLMVLAEAISQLKWLWYRNTGAARRLSDMQVFDQASRGPWGSFKMVWLLRHWTFAYIGALLTITLLAFEPLVQQVVAYPLRRVAVGPASIGRIVTYIGHGTEVIDDAEDDYAPEVGLMAAIHAGILDSANVPILAPSCSSGNCTWERFTTLAFCTRCADVTGDLTEYCPSGATSCGNASLSFRQFKLPGGFLFTDVPNEFHWITVNSSIDRIAAANDDGFVVAGIKDPMFAFARLLTSSVDYPKVHIDNATACAMYPCLRTYDVSVNDGRLASQEIYNMTWYNESGYPIENINSLPVILRPPENFTKALGQNVSTEYSFSNPSFFSTAAYLKGIFIGGRMVNTSYEQEAQVTTNYTTTNIDLLDTVMDSSDLNALTQGLADSMTLFLRNSSDTSGLNRTTHAIGTAWGNQAFVHVRWPWLFAPAVMVILTLALLIVVMVQNARRKCCVWKSSILASIYHGLERQPDGLVEQVTEMEHAAKETAVNLNRSDDGRLTLLVRS